VRSIWFVDTSVLCELLRVPGMWDAARQIGVDYETRRQNGDAFVMPVTAVIETGNHICNVKAGDRRGAAQRFVTLLEAIRRNAHPCWVLHETAWDGDFLGDLLAGSIARQPFVDLAGNATMGAGDVAILAERERFRAGGAFGDVRIWTLDDRLAAYS
jgi:hypothetical protein